MSEQAIQLEGQGRSTEAKSLLTRAITVYPYDAGLYYNLGNCYRRQRDYPRAIDQYKKAIDIEPKFTEAHYNLGLAYDSQKDYVKAEASYRAALVLDPSHPKATFNLGAALLDMGRYDEARRMFLLAGKSSSADPIKIKNAIREVNEKEALTRKNRGN